MNDERKELHHIEKIDDLEEGGGALAASLLFAVLILLILGGFYLLTILNNNGDITNGQDNSGAVNIEIELPSSDPMNSKTTQ